jgi:hypothetical protein
MKRITRKYMLLYLVISAAIGISLVGCSHTPPRPVELDQARTAYGEARDNPQVASRAPVALREAEESLLRAERAQREADQAYQQVRAATTQSMQLERELSYTKEELAAKEAAAKEAAARARTKHRTRAY